MVLTSISSEISMQGFRLFSYFLKHNGSQPFAICCTIKLVVSHPNNTAYSDSVGEKSVILHSLWFGGTSYFYIMGVSQLNILNSWIRIQLMNLDLNVDFIPQNITALPLVILLLLVKRIVFPPWWPINRGEELMVTPIGATLPTLVECGWRWKTMITCTTCYGYTIVTEGTISLVFGIVGSLLYEHFVP